MAIENPIYKLIDKRGDIEIREYQSMIIAFTQVSLPYRSAQSEGFRRIANYIFGGWATADRALYYQNLLKTEVEKLDLETDGKYMAAQYNSPGALPPFRKNEILVRIK